MVSWLNDIGWDQWLIILGLMGMSGVAGYLRRTGHEEHDQG